MHLPEPAVAFTVSWTVNSIDVTSNYAGAPHYCGLRNAVELQLLENYLRREPMSANRERAQKSTHVCDPITHIQNLLRACRNPIHGTYLFPISKLIIFRH